MIKSIIINLDRGVRLLHNITDEEYSDKSTPPYHSSIGGHVRHVLDLFQCIFNGLPQGYIDLTARNRDKKAEEETESGIAYFEKIKKQLEQLEEKDFNNIVTVVDDLGLGLYTQQYTLGGLLIQAHSHAIHHYASIGYIIAQLDIQLPDNDFGYNPSTPKVAVKAE